MQNFELLADRIRYLMKIKNLKQSDLAKAAGVKDSSVNAWLSGKTKGLKGDVAADLSRNLDISFRWLTKELGTPDEQHITVLEEGETPDPNEYVQIKAYGVSFGCGGCPEPTYEELHDVEPWTLRRAWFQANHLNPDHCKIFVVEGNSMEHTLHDGDSVIVDENSKEIKSGWVYAFSLNHEMKIKRLYKNAHGDLRIHSDNPAYEDDVIMHGDETVFFRMIGRVISHFGSGGLK